MSFKVGVSNLTEDVRALPCFEMRCCLGGGGFSICGFEADWAVLCNYGGRCGCHARHRANKAVVVEEAAAMRGLEANWAMVCRRALECWKRFAVDAQRARAFVGAMQGLTAIRALVEWRMQTKRPMAKRAKSTAAIWCTFHERPPASLHDPRTEHRIACIHACLHPAILCPQELMSASRVVRLAVQPSFMDVPAQMLAGAQDPAQLIPQACNAGIVRVPWFLNKSSTMSARKCLQARKTLRNSYLRRALQGWYERVLYLAQMRFKLQGAVRACIKLMAFRVRAAEERQCSGVKHQSCSWHRQNDSNGNGARVPVMAVRHPRAEPQAPHLCPKAASSTGEPRFPCLMYFLESCSSFHFCKTVQCVPTFFAFDYLSSMLELPSQNVFDVFPGATYSLLHFFI
eukprot:scaffold13224_cov20-Tisochrysis_lutea.AAC.1